MAQPSEPPLPDQLADALAWWAEAGVDYDFGDDATAWLSEKTDPSDSPRTAQRQAAAPQAKSAPARPPTEKIGDGKQQWSTNLAAFREWWLTSPDLDEGGAFPRIAALGNAGAELMVIVPEPEQDDSETVLSGAQGRLLTGFLSAAGIAEEKIYIAAALPRHTPMADWDTLVAAGLGEVLAHHVGLVAPKRILALGRIVLPLLGHEMAQGSAVLREFNHDGCSVPLMGTGSLGELLRSSGRRERFWKNWLDWTYGDSNTK